MGAGAGGLGTDSLAPVASGSAPHGVLSGVLATLGMTSGFGGLPTIGAGSAGWPSGWGDGGWTSGGWGSGGWGSGGWGHGGAGGGDHGGHGRPGHGDGGHGYGGHGHERHGYGDDGVRDHGRGHASHAAARDVRTHLRDHGVGSATGRYRDLAGAHRPVAGSFTRHQLSSASDANHPLPTVPSAPFAPASLFGVVAGAAGSTFAGGAGGSGGPGAAVAVLLLVGMFVFPSATRQLRPAYLRRLTWIYLRPDVRPG